jgi:MYXO-CTERM domain-containing protein
MEGFVSIATDWPRPLLDKEIVGGGKINIFTNTYRIARTAIAAIATSAIVVFIPRPAQALVPIFTGSGSGFSIPDNNPTGAFSDIVVADNFLINDITVGLSLSHPWIGDLIATLTHADTNTTVDLFNRVDAISSGIGHGSNLNGSYYFNDAFTGDLWTVASSVANSSIIPGGDYFPTGPDFSAKVPMLTTISGLSSSGTWRLKISDVSGNDTGTLGSWSLTLQGSSPESVPGPLPLLGAGAAFGWSRRLRKRSRAAL